MIKSSLGHFTGLVFFKGTPAADADQPVGKNLVSKVPCEMATVLGQDNPRQQLTAEHPFSSLWIFMDGLIRACLKSMYHQAKLL